MLVEFKIADKVYQVPETITVGAFERAIAWNLDDLNNLKPFVASLIECSIYELAQLDEEVLAIITGMCLQRMQLQESELHHYVDDYNLIDPETITFGQWVDLDVLFAKEPGQQLSKIIAILYGAEEHIVKKWDVNHVWGAMTWLSEWRKSVYTEYEEFFEIKSNDTNLGDDDDDSTANIQLMWWEAIMALANEDFLKIHQVVERPWREALNYLTWKKAQVQKQKLQQLKAKNDLQRRTK